MKSLHVNEHWEEPGGENPHIFMDLLETEVGSYLDWPMLMILKRVSKRLSQSWRLGLRDSRLFPSNCKLHGFPSSCDDLHLSQLPRLEKLYLSDNIWVEGRGIALLSHLKTLSLENPGPQFKGECLTRLQCLRSLCLRNFVNRCTDTRFVSLLTNLENITIKFVCGLTDAMITPLTNLTALALLNQGDLTSSILPPLVNLRELSLKDLEGRTIPREKVSHLTGLEKLTVKYHDTLALDAFMCVTDLRYLCLYDSVITDNVLGTLTTLTCLRLRLCGKVTDKGLSLLVNLKTLDLRANTLIDGDCIKELTNLECLHLDDLTVNGAHVSKLTGLRTLSIEGARAASNACLSSLANLRSLALRNTKKRSWGFDKLTDLTDLDITGSKWIEDTDLVALTQLTNLNARSAWRVTSNVISNMKNIKTAKGCTWKL